MPPTKTPNSDPGKWLPLWIMLAAFLTIATAMAILLDGPLTRRIAALQPTVTYTPQPSDTPRPTSTRTPMPTPTKTSTPTLSPTPSATPTRTDTPQPTLEAHTWQVDPILVEMDNTTLEALDLSNPPPSFALYANGLLIRSKLNILSQYEVLSKMLSRQEICALLNTIDRNGFFEYDQSIYVDPLPSTTSTQIQVNAWEKNTAYGQSLERWVYEGTYWYTKECMIYGCGFPPVILQALAGTYKLLDQYAPEGLQPVRFPIPTPVVPPGTTLSCGPADGLLPIP